MMVDRSSAISYKYVLLAILLKIIPDIYIWFSIFYLMLYEYATQNSTGYYLPRKDQRSHKGLELYNGKVYQC